MEQVLITGCNRGLGLEWARQYAEEGGRVFATCRYPSEAFELQGLAEEFPNLSIHRLDVTRPDHVNALAVELRDQAIDILVNNAGVYLEKYEEAFLGGVRYDAWEYTFRVNTLGAMRMIEAFLPHLMRGQKKLIAVISTHMASIADITAPGAYYYRSTKAALNAAVKALSYELRPKGIGILLLHPGWVRTRMGGDQAPLLPPESVKGMRGLLQEFSLEMSGRFIRYDGVEMPW